MPQFNQLFWVSVSYLTRPRISLGVPALLLVFLLIACLSPFTGYIRNGFQPSVTEYVKTEDLTNWNDNAKPIGKWSEMIAKNTEAMEINGSFTDPNLWAYLQSLPELKSLEIVKPTPEIFLRLIQLKHLETLTLRSAPRPIKNRAREAFIDNVSISSLKPLANLRELKTIGFPLDQIIPAIEENQNLHLWICHADDHEIDKQDLEGLKEFSQLRVLQLTPLSKDLTSFEDLSPVLQLPNLELCFVGGTSISQFQQMFTGWNWFRPTVIFLGESHELPEKEVPQGRLFDLMIIFFAIFPLKIVFRHGWDCSLNEMNWVIPKISQSHSVVLYGLASLIAVAEIAICSVSKIYLLPGLALIGITFGFTAITFDNRFRANRILTNVLSKIVFYLLMVYFVISTLEFDLGRLTWPYLNGFSHTMWVFLVRFLSGNAPLTSLGLTLFGILQVRSVVASFGDLHRRTVEMGWQDPTVLTSTSLEKSQENRDKADLEPDPVSKFYRNRLLRKLIELQQLKSLSEKWGTYRLVAAGPVMKLPLGLLVLVGVINWFVLFTGVSPSIYQSNSRVIDFLSFVVILVPLIFYGVSLNTFSNAGKRLASDLLLKPISRRDVNRRLIGSAVSNSLICLLFILPSAIRIEFREGQAISTSGFLILLLSFVGMFFLATGLQIFSAVSQRSLKVRESWDEYISSLVWLLVQVLMLIYFAFSFVFDFAEYTGGVGLLLFIASIAILAANIIALKESEFV